MAAPRRPRPVFTRVGIDPELAAFFKRAELKAEDEDGGIVPDEDDRADGPYGWPESQDDC